MSEIIQLKIKKEYAASLIEHLKKEEAIEVIEDYMDEIPDWQKKAVLKTLKEVEENPSLAKPWDEIKKKYQRPE
ncbi:MAG: addiction module protein [Chitinophagaceae bacterium]|nr:addiction module protein [Chitinophagaceae bacterium]